VAAPSIEGFYSTWQTPGVFVGVSQSLAQTSDIESQLDRDDFSANCTRSQRGDYAYGRFTGQYVVWTDCGGTPTELYIVAMMPDDNAFLALAQVQVTSTADLEALDRIMSSFQVTDSLP
jgi:serine protease Do